MFVFDLQTPPAPAFLDHVKLADVSSMALSAQHQGYVYVLDRLSMHALFAGAGLQAKAVVTDPDAQTAWDGLLEYRWDFGNDDVWDTDYSVEGEVVGIPLAAQGNFTLGVRDRFHGVDVLRHNNLPPLLAAIGSKMVTKGSPLIVDVNASDPE